RLPALAAGPAAAGLVGAGFAAGTAVCVGGATTLFAGARLVVTDRLHAHVLAGLMGIPHVVLDNSYGKIGAVYRATTSGFRTARHVGSVAEFLGDQGG
ncbi:MAG: polysaccharide pyruvyl transferase family protein, partial [Nocardioides sp.]|uniref:polysaccharide pyruvyl transferase family protein n=1 Tax=Nocardioides sp. TaxID=35761 RepID=UPI0039E4E39C